MDKIKLYREFIKQILTEHSPLNSTKDTVQSRLIFDIERDHYQLSYVVVCLD